MNNIIYAGKHLLTLSVNRHTHSSWELIYCTSGSGVMQFDDFELPYKTGDIVAIPPMMPHANVSSEGFSNYHINMSDLVPVSSEPILMHDDSNAFLLNVFEAAYFHFNSGPEKRDAFLPHYGDLLVSYMSQSQHQVKVSKVVEEIQTNIIQNYPDCNYELDKFLQSFPFSYDYLRKLFKKELGITPHKFLSDKRLQTAADMLVYGYNGSKNIAEISQLCGYREPLYFSRMFKKKFGIAPSYYLDSQLDSEKD